MSARMEATAVETPSAEEPVLDPIIEEPVTDSPVEEVITPEVEEPAATAVILADKPEPKAKTGVLAGLGAAFMSALGSI